MCFNTRSPFKCHQGGGLGEALLLRSAFCASGSLSSPTKSQEPGGRLVTSDDEKEQNKGFSVSCPPPCRPAAPPVRIMKGHSPCTLQAAAPLYAAGEATGDRRGLLALSGLPK